MSNNSPGRQQHCETALQMAANNISKQIVLQSIPGSASQDHKGSNMQVRAFLLVETACSKLFGLSSPESWLSLQIVAAVLSQTGQHCPLSLLQHTTCIDC